MDNKTKQAMQMALEALEVLLTCKHGEFCDHYQDAERQSKKAITALRETLAQPQDLTKYREGYEQGKFDAQMEAQPQGKGEDNGQRNDNCNTKYSDDNSGNFCSNSDSEAPVKPQSEWVDLTDDEVIALEREVGCFAIGQLEAVIVKFKEKNTPPSVEAAIEATKEKAAQKCDDLYKHDRRASGYDEGWNDALGTAEQAIRGMK